MVNESKIEQAIKLLLEGVGEDINREGLLDTPKRVANMYKEIFKDNSNLELTTFSNSKNYDQIVLIKDINYFSFCEHHLLPFYGKAHIGYLPDKRYIGLSKIARIVEIFSNRLQVQERLTQQIATYINDNLIPLGVGVIIEGHHLCMSMRGVKKTNHQTITSCLLGNFRKQEVKNEFINLIRRNM